MFLYGFRERRAEALEFINGQKPPDRRGGFCCIALNNELSDGKSRHLHVFDHHLAKTRTADLCCALHQSGKIVGDFLAGD